FLQLRHFQALWAFPQGHPQSAAIGWDRQRRVRDKTDGEFTSGPGHRDNGAGPRIGFVGPLGHRQVGRWYLQRGEIVGTVGPDHGGWQDSPVEQATAGSFRQGACLGENQRLPSHDSPKSDGILVVQYLHHSSPDHVRSTPEVRLRCGQRRSSCLIKRSVKLIPMPSEELYPRVRVRWCDAIYLSSDSL